MKLKKITAVALAAGLSLALLSACGNSNANTGDSSDAEPVTIKVGQQRRRTRYDQSRCHPRSPRRDPRGGQAHSG